MNDLPPMTLLDYMVSTKENLMLKAFLPYIDKGFQPFLATYIKYTELLATIYLFKENGSIFPSNQEHNDFPDIISCLLPYVSEQERQTFEMIGNLKNAMTMFEEYKDIFENMNMENSFSEEAQGDSSNDYPEESDSEHSSDNMNISDTLSSLLTPEQQLMFEQLSSLMN